jgi:hypothetical protein
MLTNVELDTLIAKAVERAGESERERIIKIIEDCFMPTGTMEDYHQGWNDCRNKILQTLIGKE